MLCIILCFCKKNRKKPQGNVYLKLHGCLWSLIHIIILDRKPHNYDQSTLFFGNTAPDVQSTHTHTQTTNQKIMNQVMDVSTIIISRKRKEGQGKVNMFHICPTGDWLYRIPIIFGGSYQELYCGYDNSTLNHDQHTHTHTVYHYLHIS